MLQGVPDASPRCDLSVYSYFKEAKYLSVSISLSKKEKQKINQEHIMF